MRCTCTSKRRVSPARITSRYISTAAIVPTTRWWLRVTTAHEHLAHDHTGGGAPASTCGPDCVRERFSRLLTTLVPLSAPAPLATDAAPNRARKMAPDGSYPPETQCFRWRPEPAWVSTRSSTRWAPAGWVKSTGRRDSKLGRTVAIKVLLPAVANDADRLARFEREAKTLASLNHPNIAQLYGLEDGPGGSFLVMEFVEGPTLADRIARGPIAADDALRIASQIAEALEAAHEQGIIHRDLKPANVKVRPDGMVKVLDFGLAKVVEPVNDADVSRSPTVTSPAMMTNAGVILGTAAYMSPEQARGQAVDKRTDIWAFGCVLYEMLTGRPVFGGRTVTDVLAAILEREPDWKLLPDSAPAGLQRLIRRCLAKDPKTRLHDIADARLEIDDARTGTQQEHECRESTADQEIRSTGVSRHRGRDGCRDPPRGLWRGAQITRRPVTPRPMPGSSRSPTIRASRACRRSHLMAGSSRTHRTAPVRAISTSGCSRCQVGHRYALPMIPRTTPRLTFHRTAARSSSVRRGMAAVSTSCRRSAGRRG